MQNIGYIIDKLLRNTIYKIIVIHWISYQPFEQQGPVDLIHFNTFRQVYENVGGIVEIKIKIFKRVLVYKINKFISLEVPFEYYS